MSLHGLRNMSSEYDEVRAVINELASKVIVANEELTAQHIGTHSLTHSLTYSLTHLLTHLRT